MLYLSRVALRLSFAILAFALFLASAGRAQEAHWGLQGDYFTGQVPSSIVEQIEDLIETPDIDGKLFDAGLVRFHQDGSPNFAFEYTSTRVTLDGSLQTSLVQQELRGSGTLRGVMATKFANFFSRPKVSFGLAFGGGVGKLEANYYRYTVPPGPSVIFDREEVDYVVPTFQAIAQVDVRPVRWVSLSPFYGMRNGVLGWGGAIRIHFTR